MAFCTYTAHHIFSFALQVMESFKCKVVNYSGMGNSVLSVGCEEDARSLWGLRSAQVHGRQNTWNKQVIIHFSREKIEKWIIFSNIVAKGT